MDDDGAPIAMDDVPERGSLDLGSPVRNFNFSIPFFQQFVETGSEASALRLRQASMTSHQMRQGDGDDWSDDDDDKMLTPKLKNMHSMWKTTPNPQSASNEPDQGYGADEGPPLTPTSPLSASLSAFVFPGSPRTPRTPTSKQ